jgi:hypothetical protein
MVRTAESIIADRKERQVIKDSQISEAEQIWVTTPRGAFEVAKDVITDAVSRGKGSKKLETCDNLHILNSPDSVAMGACVTALCEKSPEGKRSKSVVTFENAGGFVSSIEGYRCTGEKGGTHIATLRVARRLGCASCPNYKKSK